MDVQEIDEVQDAAPEEPNVFNDGSLKIPSRQFWSLGGHGVWWGNRTLPEAPLTVNEGAYANAKQYNDGLACEPVFQDSGTPRPGLRLRQESLHYLPKVRYTKPPTTCLSSSTPTT